jgi:spore germination protein KB
MENARLSGWQMFTLTFGFTVSTQFILLTGQLIADAKQYGWLVTVWSFLYGLALATVWLYLSKHYPGQSLIQISVKVLGKWVGGLVSALYILCFIQVAAWTTRILSDFIHINLMPRTPISVFNLMVLFVCAYAVVKGIESIAMVSELAVPYIFLAFWIPFLIMIREWDWQNFKIPYTLDLWNTIASTKYSLAFPFMETVSLMMIFPYVQRKLKTSFLMGIASVGVILSIYTFCTIGILGVNRGSHLIYPVYVIFREMQYSGFIEHLEAIIATNILLLVCLKLSVLFYCAVSGVCQLFHVKRRSAVTYPMIWVISAYSLLFANVIDNIAWFKKYLFSYYALYAIVFPLLLIMGTWLRLRKQVHKRGTSV